MDAKTSPEIDAPRASPPTTETGNEPGAVVETGVHVGHARNDHFYARVFGLAATSLLALLLYRILAPFIGPLIWAVFIAFLLHPLHVRLSATLKGRENLSAGLLTVATFAVVVGPLTAMSAAFVAQAGDLVRWVNDKFASQQPSNLLSDWPWLASALHWAHETLGTDAAQLQTWIAQALRHLPNMLAGLGGQIFLGAVNTVVAFGIMLFMMFFLVRDGASYIGLLRELVPMTPARRDELFDYVGAVTRAVVFGTGVTALVQGTLVGVAFAITGLASPLVFGVLAALFALLPFGGTALAWIPAAAVLGVQQHWGMFVVMVFIGLISSSIDNLLRPLLISGRVDVGTLTVFLGVLGGAIAFGPAGLFLGPVVLALIIALMRFARDQRRIA